MTEKTEKPPEKDGLTLVDLKDQLGADKVEAVDAKGNLLESTDPGQEQRLLDLISGKRKPENEFVAYLVAKLTEARTEFAAVTASTQELTVRLQQLKRRGIVLEGEHNKYLEDLKIWEGRNLPPDPVPEDPKTTEDEKES